MKIACEFGRQQSTWFLDRRVIPCPSKTIYNSSGSPHTQHATHPMQMCFSKQDLCSPDMPGWASHWGWPQQAPETGAVLRRMFSIKHQLWDLWFYHNVDLSSRRCSAADVSSGDQLWEEKNLLLGPSFERLSTITHNAFMCFNTEAKDGCGWSWEPVFFMFWWHSRFVEFPKWRPQSHRNSKFFSSY